MGRTSCCCLRSTASENFNSLAPYGANQREIGDELMHNIFQLTRPVWGEPSEQSAQAQRSFISTHSPRMGRTLYNCVSRALYHHFNSLAPYGANLIRGLSNPAGRKFQLTRPVWGEPLCLASFLTTIQFQLTRPVWGEPKLFKNTLLSSEDFNSLAPYGANLLTET